jgi:HEXXH motif-containing protein
MKTAARTAHPLHPPWPEDLGSSLADFVEARELRPRGLGWETYSTEGFLKSNAQRSAVNRASACWFDRIEELGENTQQLLDSLRLRYATLSKAEELEVVSLLACADKLLVCVPEVRASVQSLVRSIHVIQSNGLGYDCSFSDPAIPFSIFVSIPFAGEKQRVLRVAEAVTHECMHLQLTAWEAREPMVHPENKEATWHSPWKGGPRKLQGVLHGMYVFKVISYVHSKMIRSGALSEADVAFALRRIDQINEELEQIEGVQNCLGFTPSGVALTNKILSNT